jgi:hypothetical protein
MVRLGYLLCYVLRELTYFSELVVPTYTVNQDRMQVSRQRLVDPNNDRVLDKRSPRILQCGAWLFAKSVNSLNGS